MNIAHYEMLQELGIEIEKPGEINGPDNYSHEMVIGETYKTPEAGRNRRPHLYNRITRFMYCFTQLAGQSGHVPDEIVARVSAEFNVPYTLEQYVSKRLIKCYYKYKRQANLIYDPKTIWYNTRKFLKQEKLGLYYNRIPFILSKLGVPHPTLGDKYDLIMNDFKLMSDRFDPCLINVKYFPDLRYVALCLMQVHGVEFKYEIPLLNTRRILKKSAAKFEILYASIE